MMGSFTRAFDEFVAHAMAEDDDDGPRRGQVRTQHGYAAGCWFRSSVKKSQGKQGRRKLHDS